MKFILIGILLIILSAIYCYAKKQFSYWKNRNVLFMEPTFPLGTFKNVGETIHWASRLREVYTKFKGKDLICGIFAFMCPQIMILDLDIVKAITIKDFNNFVNRGIYYHETEDPFSAHLFNIDGEKWRYLRTRLSPSFTSGKLKIMFGSLINVSDDLTSLLTDCARSGTVVDAKDVCSRFILDAIGSTVLGINCNCLKTGNAEMMDAAKGVFNFRVQPAQFKFLFQNTYVNLSRKLNLKLIRPKIDKYFNGVMKDIVQHRETNETKNNDFINILLKSQNISQNETNFDVDQIGPLTYNVLKAQAFIMFFAGFEPTSTAMHFCLYELAYNQDVQTKLRNEVNEITEKYDGELTYEGIMEMEYLDHVINETLRKYSPVSTLFRKTIMDYKVPGTSHVIEKDTEVLIPVYSIHNDPDIFPNPTKFDPDRFTPENIKKRHPYSYLAFGEGPRHCMGKRYSLLVLRVVIAKAILKFKFNVNSKTANPIHIDPTDIIFIISAVGGIWLDIEKI